VAGSFPNLAKIVLAEIRRGKMPAKNQRSVFCADIWPGYIYAPDCSPNFLCLLRIFLRRSGLAPGCSTFLRPRTWPEKVENFFSQAQGDIKNWKSVFCLDIWPEYIYAMDFPAFQAPSVGARISAQTTSAAFLPRQLGRNSAALFLGAPEHH
jgi:hypothetical protein